MRWLRANEPTVVSEVLDGDVMVINLTTGTYYNLENVAATVWTTLDRANDVEVCQAAVRAGFDGDEDSFGAHVARFVSDLVEASLVVETEPPDGGPGPIVDQTPTDRRPFTPPTLEPYVDLQNLIALDPILETDEQGWPTGGGDR